MSIVAYKDHGYFTDCLYGAQSILCIAGDQHFHVGTALPNALNRNLDAAKTDHFMVILQWSISFLFGDEASVPY